MSEGAEMEAMAEAFLRGFMRALREELQPKLTLIHGGLVEQPASVAAQLAEIERIAAALARGTP